MNQSLASEMENARLFAGLSIEEFQGLPGDTRYAQESLPVGIYESKSDVLAYYRSQKLSEAIVQHISLNKPRKGV